MRDRPNVPGHLWPVADSGLQVSRLAKSLFPGGPSACAVVGPFGCFHFGINFEPASGAVCMAVVTSFGTSSLGPVFHQVLDTQERLVAAQAAVRDYLITHKHLFHFRPFEQVEFRSGDGTINAIF